MNQNIPSDPLDQMLHQWADEHAASSEHLDTLQQRILSSLSNDADTSGLDQIEPFSQSAKEHDSGHPAIGPVIKRTTARRLPEARRSGVVGFLSGVTVTVLLAAAWFTYQAGDTRRNQQIVEIGSAIPPEYAWLSEDQLHSKSVLLSEMQELFGHQLSWLAETNSRVEVGLNERSVSDEDRAASATTVPLAVRVVVEKRDSSSSGWQLAWAVDVMSRSEELVEIAPQSGDGASILLWAYALPDGLIAVDSELSLPGVTAPQASSDSAIIRATLSNVQQDRQPSESLVTDSDGIEYRVFQTVAILDEQVS